MKSIIFMVILALTPFVLAGADSNRLDSLANEFFVKQQLAHRRSSATVTTNNCGPNTSPSPVSPKACIDMVCSKMNKFLCDEPAQINDVAIMCKGNVDGDCVNMVCNKLGRFECDEPDELTSITGMCKGISSNKCLDIACSKLGNFGCDNISEVKDVLATVCKPNVDSSCVENVCAKLGKFDCDETSELQSVANSCSI